MIINILNEKLHERFGANPPIELTVRMSEEIELFKQLDLLESLKCLCYVVDACKEKGSPYQVRGIGAASFLFYLLGITYANPLAPHYYCPKCGKVEFADAKDGFDLAPKPCICGGIMEGNGHNLHLFLKDGKLSAIEIMVEQNMYDFLSSTMKNANCRKKYITAKHGHFEIGELCYLNAYAADDENVVFDYSVTPTHEEVAHAARLNLKNLDKPETYSQLVESECKHHSTFKGESRFCCREDIYDLLISRGADKYTAMEACGRNPYQKRFPDKAYRLLNEKEKAEYENIEYLFPRAHVCELHYYFARKNRR